MITGWGETQHTLSGSHKYGLEAQDEQQACSNTLIARDGNGAPCSSLALASGEEPPFGHEFNTFSPPKDQTSVPSPFTKRSLFKMPGNKNRVDVQEMNIENKRKFIIPAPSTLTAG
ncbi:hypothetical protein EK904_001903 [Melospiza melodia maxima]|nr:hypothetical protein EK904_001903 [Melospiza melodia maxima]